MNKKIGVLTVVWLVAAIMFIVSSCESDSDAENIAKALEERLTDALDFENSEVKKGTPPQGSAAQDAPQITQLTAPEKLQLGETFTLRIQSDFASPETIAKTIVYVEGAEHYIEVLSTYSWNGAVIAGRLAPDEKLRGKDFTLKVALQTADGKTGEYKTWALSILDLEPVSGGGVLMNIQADNAESHQSGKPEGHAGEDYPQVQYIAAPEEVEPGSTIDFWLEAMIPQGHQVAAVLMSQPGSKAYVRITSFTVTQRKTQQFAGVEFSITLPSELPISAFILSFALEDNTGAVGMWYPQEFTVIRSSTDGDTDTEVDGESDSGS